MPTLIKYRKRNKVLGGVKKAAIVHASDNPTEAVSMFVRRNGPIEVVSTTQVPKGYRLTLADMEHR